MTLVLRDYLNKIIKMKINKLFLSTLLFLFFFSCADPAIEDIGLEDGFPLAIDDSGFMFIFIDENNDVWQVEVDGSGEVQGKQKIKIKSAKAVGIYSFTMFPSGWALTADGKVHIWPLLNPSTVIEPDINLAGPIKKIVSVDSDNSNNGHFACLYLDGSVVSTVFNVRNESGTNKAKRDSLFGIKDIAVGQKVLATLTSKDEVNVYRTFDLDYKPLEKGSLSTIKKLGNTRNKGTRGKKKTDCIYLIDENDKAAYWTTGYSGISFEELEGNAHYLFDYKVLHKNGAVEKIMNISDSRLPGVVDAVYYNTPEKKAFYFWVDKKGQTFVRNTKTKEDKKLDDVILKMDFFKGVEGIAEN